MRSPEAAEAGAAQTAAATSAAKARRSLTGVTIANPAAGSSAQLPLVGAKQRHRLAVAADAVHLDRGAADHEVGMDAGTVDPVLPLLVGAELERPLDAVRKPLAVGDVAGRVLVVERVEERDPG